MSVYPVTVSGLPESATMGGVENLIYAKCSGRILAITLQGAGGAVIEFAEEADAQACAGEYEMAGATVRMAQIGSASAHPPPAPPSSAKRSHAGPVLGGNAIANADLPPPPAPVQVLAPPPPEPLEPQSGASSSSSTLDASAALLHTANGVYDAASGAVPPGLVQMPSDVSTAEAAEATAVAQAATEMATASGVFVAPEPNKTVVLNKNGKEKERRLNRVGLSYRCGHCGMPKKGHTCEGSLAAAAAAAVGPDGKPLAPDAGPVLAPPKKKSKSANKTPPVASARAVIADISPTSQMYLDSDSIFNDIKSVLQQPAGGSGGSAGGAVDGSGGGGGGSGGGKGSSEGKKRKRSRAKGAVAAAAAAQAIGLGGEMPPPPPGLHEQAARSEKSALLEELDLAMSQQRPPSVITPDESDSMRTAGPSSLTAAPSSLVSASDMFSPGQLMTHLLGTPTPALTTPGLSPGTLNELGNMLQSPGVMLPSARKDAAAIPPAAAIAPELTGLTPGHA